MIHGRFRRRSTAGVGVAGALAALLLGSCGSTTTATAVYPYDEAYVYTTYYPTDVMYSSYYWADDWNYSTVYYYFISSLPVPAGLTAVSHDGGSTVDAGSTASGSATGIASAVESLARGMSVCPGQVTVTPKNSPPACLDSTKSQERSGVTIVFNGCAVGQSHIDGMIDVAVVRTASDATCAASTSIMSQTTLTVTNLSVRQSNGAGIMIPSQTATLTSTYPYRQNAQTVMATSTAELQVFDSTGKMTADLGTQGTDTLSLPDAQSYSIDGTAMVSDKAGSATATITKTGVTRSGGCCRPTGGTVVVDRTGGSSPGKTTWQFGPTCGDALRNGSKVTLPACLQ
jgi:hypothetical protein